MQPESYYVVFWIIFYTFIKESTSSRHDVPALWLRSEADSALQQCAQ